MTDENSFDVALYEGHEVLVDQQGEVWVSQRQIASILGLNVNAVTKAVNRALDDDEFDDVNSVCANLSYTGTDGKSYNVNFYNADIFLIVGYRAHKSAKARAFRRWATDLWRKAFIQEANERKLLQAENQELARRAYFAESDLERRLALELEQRYPDELGE